MPDPIVPYEIIITVGANTTGLVVVENLSKTPDTNNPESNKLRSTIDGNNNAQADLANLSSGYSDNDLIEIRVSGTRAGRATHTVNTALGSGSVTLSQSDNADASPAVDL